LQRVLKNCGVDGIKGFKKQPGTNKETRGGGRKQSNATMNYAGQKVMLRGSKKLEEKREGEADDVKSE